MDFPRYQELFELGVDAAIAGGSTDSVSEDALRTPGTDANAILAMIATVGEECTRQIAITARDRLMTSAVDDALDELVWDWFGIRRNDAASALVTETFTRAVATLSGTIPAGSRVATVDGVEFVTTTALALGVGVLTGSVVCRAVQAGISGNVAAGTITQIRSTLFDTFTCTNAALAAGGSARETDGALRARARQFWANARRGTLSAIELGALEVDGVVTSRASEVPLYVGSDQVGQWVTLVIADEQGNSNAAVRSLVETELLEWRAAGVYVETISGQVSWVVVTVACGFRAGVDTAAAVARIRRAIVAMINGLRAGEKLKRDAVYEVVRRDPDVATGTVVVTLPAGDVVPGSYQVLRTSEDRVVINP